MQRQESVLTLKKGTYDYAAEVKGKRIRKPWINGQSWHEICIWNEKYYCKEQKVLLDFFFVQKDKIPVSAKTYWPFSYRVEIDPFDDGTF